jgi:glycosyltransferase involved in cell wall biosynthesis
MSASLCVIVRNEAKRIGQCLGCVRKLVKEIVVVDTGSTDATCQVARACGAVVRHFCWSDDFAAARNEAIRHASHPWIFSMDADDLVDESNGAKLSALFASLGNENAGYMTQCASLNSGGGVTSSVGQVRIFRNDTRIRWDRRVHEQIAGAVVCAGGEVRSTDIVINHHGYVDPVVLRNKLERNMRLLELETEERPLDAITQFNRGWCLADLGRREEAIVALNLCAMGPLSSAMRRKHHVLLARCYYQTGSRTEAMAVVRAGRSLYAEDVELLYTEAQLRTGLGDLQGAEGCVRMVLAAGSGSSADCLDCAVFGSAGFYLLGLVCALQGKHEAAEEAAREATRLDPALLPAWVVLADSVVQQGRLSEVESLVLDRRTPELVQTLLQACALALRGGEAEAIEALSSEGQGESSIVRQARRWVARLSGPDARPARILDLMRGG